MIMLAIDTSSDFLRVVLADNGRIIAQEQESGLVHSKMLVPFIYSVLKKTRQELSRVKGIGIVIGPGSFTGLRIGICAVKGICVAREIPVAGVVSLDAIGMSEAAIGFNGYVCPLIDARRQQVYWSLYKNGSREEDYSLSSPQHLRNRLGDKKVLLIGDGLARWGVMLKDVPRAEFAAGTKWYPDMETVVKLAGEKLKKGETLDAMSLVPFYMYESDVQARQKQN